MIEDDFTYVLRKALTGCGMTPKGAAEAADVSVGEVTGFLDGTFSAITARKLAAVLGLNAEAFATHAVYQPRPLDVPGISRLDLPFGEDTVNAWLVHGVLFDAGFVPEDLIGELKSCGAMPPDAGFITHGHRDHIGAVGDLLAAGVELLSAGLPGTIAMIPGESITCGSLEIRACDLSGHFSPALGFHIAGLAKPALVVGDALFAGSMGKCATPAIYKDALTRLRKVLAPLPDETVLLPGHGPATTLGEERVSNPFL